MRYANTHTPKQFVASVIIDELFYFVKTIDDRLDDDTLSFRRRVKAQMEKEIERLADKYEFELGFTLPISKS